MGVLGLALALFAFAGLTEGSSWVVSGNPCVSTTSSPCGCIRTYSLFLTCKCNEEYESVIVDEHEVETGTSVVWRIHNCRHVHIKKNGFGTVGRNVRISLENISRLHLEEESFKLKGGGDERGRISFLNTSILTIPPRAFPSKISMIEFIGGEIKKIESGAFRLFALDQILFENMTVGDVNSSAFISSMQIGNWTSRGSEFKILHSHAIESSITTMSWHSTTLAHVKTKAMSAENEENVILNVEFSDCSMGLIDSFGLYFTQWSSFELANSNLSRVRERGVDLTKPADQFFTSFSGNSWGEVERNFIVTGEGGMVKVRRNSFEQCDCAMQFESLLDSNGSKTWFREEFLNNSICSISAKGAECLSQSETFLNVTSLDQFCSQEMFMCRKGVEDTTIVQLNTTLRNLAFIIGGVVGAIVVLLSVTLCCCLCGEEEEEKSSSTSFTNTSPSRSDSQSALLSSSARPRSAFFSETIEMEDKQVQTLPSDLSADVLETLRAQMNSRHLFWDAKETIDHLYDLIQVKEKADPPDVTMCGDVPPPLPKTLPPPSSARYAQIRGKGKTTPLCEYQDPSDSRTHVYSELGGNSLANPDLHVICEYTDPKDLQNHVYAELSSVRVKSSTSKMVKCPTIPLLAESHRPLPTIPSSSSVH